MQLVLMLRGPFMKVFWAAEWSLLHSHTLGKKVLVWSSTETESSSWDFAENTNHVRLYVQIQMVCYSRDTKLQSNHGGKEKMTFSKGIHFSSPCEIIVVWKVLKSFWYTTKCEKKGEYFYGNKCEKHRTPNSRAMSQENTDGKKSIGICLSVISCVLLYFFLFKSLPFTV